MKGAFFIILLGIGCYFSSLWGPFQYDDYASIVNNPDIKELGEWRNVISHNPARGLPNLTFVINYHFSHLSPWGYHLVNVIFHIFNGLLVFLLVRIIWRIMHGPHDRVQSHSMKMFAALVGILFVSHPLHTEAVTYIVQRSAILCTFFYLLSCLFYLKSIESNKSHTLFYLIAFCSAVFSSVSKEEWITLPLILLFLEILLLNPRAEKYYLTRKIWRVAPFIIFIPLWMSAKYIYYGHVGYKYPVRSISEQLFTQIYVIVNYLRFFVTPFNQCIVHNISPISSLFDVSLLLGVGVHGILVMLCLLFLRKSPLISFGILWFYLTLLPTSSFVALEEFMAEHRMYLPSIGLLLAVFQLTLMFRRKEKYLLPVLGIVACLFFALTINRNTFWKEQYTLWKDAAIKYPTHPGARINLGFALLEEKKDYPGALHEYKEALALLPDCLSRESLSVSLGIKDWKYYHNVGDLVNCLTAQEAVAKIYFILGKVEDSVNIYQQIMALYPDHAEVAIFLGEIYLMMGNDAGAEFWLRHAIQISPEDHRVYFNLGLLEMKRNRWRDASELFSKAFALKPDFLDAQRLRDQAMRQLNLMK